MVVHFSSHNRNYGCRLTEFVLKGYRAVSLENEKIRVSILLDKGTDIYEFLYKPKDVDFLFRSHLGLRASTHFEPMAAIAGGTFMDHYEGGWQELFPWGGHASQYRGVDTGLHGEVALAPWNYRVDIDSPEEVRITCSIRTRRAPFYLEKSFSLSRHRACLHIREAATNESETELQVVWGHHPAFGAPFLDEHCRIDLPPCEVKVVSALDGGRLDGPLDSSWPIVKAQGGGEVDLSRIPGPESRSEDLAYLHGFKEGWYALRNESQGLGFGMAWDPAVFRYLWFWQLYRGCPEFPFWGTEYVAALEPVTSMAAKFSDAIANNTALRFAGQATVETQIFAWAFEGADRVSRIDADGVQFGGL